MKMIAVIWYACLTLCIGKDAVAQPALSLSEKMLFKNTKSRLSIVDKKHLFQQLAIKWPLNKDQFVDKDDLNETAPYVQVVFYPVDINHDGIEDVFIMLSNPALFEAAGAQLILFTKNADGSYQKNVEVPAEDLVPLSRKHLGYPDMLLPSSETIFIVWRWNGKTYQFFQKVNGQMLPDGPNKGLEDISRAYQAGLKNK